MDYLENFNSRSNDDAPAYNWQRESNPYDLTNDEKYDQGIEKSLKKGKNEL